MTTRSSRLGIWRVKVFACKPIIPTVLGLVCLFCIGVLFRDHEITRPVRNFKTYIASDHPHVSVSRTFLALRAHADPTIQKTKAEQELQVVKDRIVQVSTYASIAREAQLDAMRQLRLLEETEANYTNFLNRPEYRALLEDEFIDKEVMNQFERELQKYITEARKIIRDAEEVYHEEVEMQTLKETLFSTKDQLIRAKKEGAFSSLVAAKAIPKSLHCISMKLMQELVAHPRRYVRDQNAPELHDPNLYHYAIFSDNVMAASVVVNSAIKNVNEPAKHVFHVVTDKMNLGAMTVWFKKRPPQGAHIEVKAVKDFKFLNSSYVPVLRQLESANMQRFYFQTREENATDDASNMKFRNPKYLSMLNHLRFYLPEMYPKLHKILFLDDDIVVQKDLTGLWEVDMDGNVNGAVETCLGSFHRYDNYLNFSHPLIQERFDPKACGWAYGMNFFDLDAWRREKSTEEYHYWQNMNENRTLWNLGTLPPGLMTFYSTTKPLDKHWHVLGLGYNASISIEQIKSAAVIHYNGNKKPWLDLAFDQYRKFWTKYVDYDMDFVQMCNFGH